MTPLPLERLRYSLERLCKAYELLEQTEQPLQRWHLVMFIKRESRMLAWRACKVMLHAIFKVGVNNEKL